MDAPSSEPSPESWYLVALTGVANVVVGVLALAYPSPSLKTLALMLGANLVAVGGFLILRGFVEGGRDPEPAPTVIILGMLALIAGLLVIRHPGNTVLLLALAFAIYLIVAGALDLSHALLKNAGRLQSALRGIVRIAGGTVILAWPEIDLETLALLAGIVLCVHGAVDLREAYTLRSARPNLQRG